MITAYTNNETLNGNNNPGTTVVEISDVQDFIAARLDDRGEDYFSTNSITAEGLLASTASQIATHKTAMTSVDANGLGADGLAGAITTASGFDDFIRDLPDLVSQEMITAALLINL